MTNPAAPKGSSRENYDALPDEARTGLDEILYAEHMGDVMRGLRRLAVGLGIPVPVHDRSLWTTNEHEWPWEIVT